MKTRILPLLVLIGALAALAGTVSYAVARATDGGSAYGMMGRSDYAMMGSAGRTTAWYLNGTGKAVPSIAAARERAQRFADRLGLETAEVMQFTNNFYGQLDDRQGKPATEVLVDPQTGAVTLEYGPAMMWNTRYGMMATDSATTGMMGGTMMGGEAGMMGSGSSGGMMSAGGMMGRYGGSPSWTPSAGSVTTPVTAAQARRLANRWLAAQGSGATVARPDALPGYYTMDTVKNRKVYGMLSVNKQTGAVWSHWWHGRFVAMEE